MVLVKSLIVVQIVTQVLMMGEDMLDDVSEMSVGEPFCCIFFFLSLIYRRLNLLNNVFIVFNLMETRENGKKG